MIKCLKLKEKIGSICSRFQYFDQQDSREFLTYLLDGLHEELKFVTENSTNFDEILIKSPEAFQVSLFFFFTKDLIKKINKERTFKLIFFYFKEKLAGIEESYFENNWSKISSLFHFIICMKNECLNPDCSMTSLKFDMASFLVVPIIKNNKIRIEDCLKPIFERKKCNE